MEKKSSKIVSEDKEIRLAQVNMPMYEIKSEINDQVINTMPNIYILLKAVVDDDSRLPYEKHGISYMPSTC